MCSRFQLNHPLAEIMTRFHLGVPPPWPNATEFRPTDRAMVVAADGAHVLRWGLKVEWDSSPLINARVETVRDKPTFRRLLGNRLLVLASAWWEWDVAKVKMRLAATDGRLLSFAGLYDGDTFVILTRAATPDIATVHDRMPLLVDERWLQGGAPQMVETPIMAVMDQPPPRQPDLFG
jgi:putative SOS response-associated peptidase YedK